jgi:tRNA (guanine37-N1)-methyltransferase
MCRDVLGTSILRLARERGAVTFGIHDIRDFTDDRHRSVDDRPYGGGPGMLLRPGPVVRCVERIQREHGHGHVVMLTPAGRRFDQSVARSFAECGHLVLVCGRYEGFDERIRTGIEWDEIAIGDYVLAGGELPALVVVEAAVRLIPGVLGCADSSESESFEGDLLDYPQFTRPRSFRGMDVPEILMSGDHGAVAAWRRAEAERLTAERESATRKARDGG